MDSITITVKERPEKGCQETRDMVLPVIPPHELTSYLMGKGLVKFDAAKAQQHWDHLRENNVAWMEGFVDTNFEPVALYADEAEYTVSKEKILMVFCSG